MNYKEENLTAILGPTNTGKTFIAFEKILSYSNGIFGFPLRLLARENYDKAIKRVGLSNVALITGEEKIIPKEAKYFFCTVESMPVKKIFDCVVIDEVQLAADYERGHIFTDRILNFRGNFETIFLGSHTMESILKKLFLNINIEKKDRFSKLSFLPKQNLSKLKPRSAIIAFNINKVYEIAENIRTHKGGTAVVLGSLSPRTRNSQVELYENNKVDYLVATDAIGMGLNLNINHVCFTSLEKFDGRYNRNLTPNEIGQIAGRAGRYKNDGSFGYTKQAGSLDPLIIQSIETHSYDQIQKIYWRNSNIDFSSVERVLSSLKQFPIRDFFIHKKNAIDEINFKNLVDDNEIKKYLISKENIILLWDICRIPDFEKVFNDNYLFFLKDLFLTIIKNNYRIPEDWIDNKIAKLENFNGGIPELSIKISQIRTWTYISNHHNWLENPIYWQEKTQKIENELSDNLHNSLTNKFIDFSSKFFIDSPSDKIIDKISLNKNNEIVLDDKKYGFISGFDLILFKNQYSHSLFSLTHVKKSVRYMIEEKITAFLNAPNNSINLGDIKNINLNEKINIYWGEEPVGILTQGSKIFKPIAEALNSEFISTENKLLISAKLQDWIDTYIVETLQFTKDNNETDVSSNVRAIIYNCIENLGMLPIDDYVPFLKNIDKGDKLILTKLGIRIGVKFFYIPNLLKKAPLELCAILWKVYYNYTSDHTFPLPEDGRVSFETNTKFPKTYWNAIGYINLKNFAIRVDIFERIFFIARQKYKFGPFIESPDLMNPVGCNSTQLRDILDFCGYKSIILVNDRNIYFTDLTKKINKSKTQERKITKNRRKKTNKKLNINHKDRDPNSPFAVLEKLL